VIPEVKQSARSSQGVRMICPAFHHHALAIKFVKDFSNMCHEYL
jgi:hypothetical protein